MNTPHEISFWFHGCNWNRAHRTTFILQKGTQFPAAVNKRFQNDNEMLKLPTAVSTRNPELGLLRRVARMRMPHSQFRSA
ncbi:hypothetical protein BIW11_03544 [Tropilaelaps mercedesae]|uniref:Uncharacterized protein n=1 Tax=Tropilaelaps mercedesae TaxID=418985 RepID=A0A1V9XJR4_9ACAR|nr:hypothetical protein BIW11_03544 [Tropilaelaps mercedesae]